MARVSLIEENDHPELAALIARLKGGRGGRLLNLYKLLLHSPPLAETWFEHIGATRWKTGLDGVTREIAIIRIGYLNRVDYVIKAHVPAYALQEGMTLEQCDALQDWEPSSLFTEAQRAVLAFTDAMTREVQVPDAVWEEVRKHFTERQAVELAILAGAYNMHTRVLAALQIDPEAPAR